MVAGGDRLRHPPPDPVASRAPDVRHHATIGGRRRLRRRGMPMPLPPNRMDYLPMIDRPVIKWPNNARVAFWVAPNIEHYEYLPPLDGVRNPWPRSPLPDVPQFSLHEYGNRVGFWRLLEGLDEFRIRCSTTLNI